MRPFPPRPVTRLPVVTHRRWTLKRFAIRYGDPEFDEQRFDGGRSLALECLPLPAMLPERPGVGFIVEHQGNAVDYVVLCWWDRENELPIRVFVSDNRAAWRPARGSVSVSVCVWDLDVIWQEREAYVATMLNDGPPASDAYLARG